MDNKKDKEMGRISGSSPCRVGYMDTLCTLRAKIRPEEFDPAWRGMAEAAAMIMAEVMTLPADAPIRVDGLQLRAETVRAVYDGLTREDVEAVIRKYRTVCSKIRFPKSYLRTALYNQAFEADAAAVNDMAQFIPWVMERGHA